MDKTHLLQDFIFMTKYARWSDELGRRETYHEACDRVLNMHFKKYANCHIDREIHLASEFLHAQKILGSQRALQFGGRPIERKNARLYNCCVSYCDRPRFFQEALWLLLCGCGTGFSVQNHHIAKLPDLRGIDKNYESTFVIPDSIEGWADAVGILINSYLVGQPHSSMNIVFDYSEIRAEGEPISSCSGKAPGPEPLRRSLEKVRAVLESAVERSIIDEPRLRPIDCYDIVMHISDAVLSGGIRRSATICVFSPDDQEMLTAKTGDWLDTNPQRARSNNSALLLRDEVTEAQFKSFSEHIKEYGEPGFVWADNTEILFNPCVEIGMYPVDIETGLSGWAFCNLTEINMKEVKTAEDFEKAAEAAAILGTLQAGYTKFEYLGETSENIAKREALLGVSMTGMMDSPEIAFDPDLQRSMAKKVLETNKRIAGKIGINLAARATCVKPSGTAASLLGTSNGIHPHHSMRYFRRVQSNLNDKPTQFYETQNPRSVEPSLWNPNDTDVVITFCTEADPRAQTKFTVHALDLLKKVKLTKENWVDSGVRPELCTKPWLSHNVSNTIHIEPEEWDDVIDYIYENRHSFSGVSLLPESGELEYPQAPFVNIWNEEEIVDYYGVGALMASGLIVDAEHAFGDLWLACRTALGGSSEALTPLVFGTLSHDTKEVRKELDYIDNYNQKTIPLRKDWVRRARQFSERYFDNDSRQMTYCLKRVHHCKLWHDIHREIWPVFYEEMDEQENTMKLSEPGAACGGGVCEIIKI